MTAPMALYSSTAPVLLAVGGFSLFIWVEILTQVVFRISSEAPGAMRELRITPLKSWRACVDLAHLKRVGR